MIINWFKEIPKLQLFDIPKTKPDCYQVIES